MYHSIPVISTAVSYLFALEHSVSHNLSQAAVRTRPDVSNGLWCCLLLPITLLISCARYPTPIHYQLTCAVALGLLLSSVLLVAFLSVSASALSGSAYSHGLAPGVVAALGCVWILGKGVVFSLALCTTSTCVYTAAVTYVLTALPTCFTVGEAMLVVQSVVLLCAGTVGNIERAASPLQWSDEEIVDLIVQMGLLTMVAILFLVSHLNGRRHLKSLLWCVGGALAALLLCLHAVLGQSSLLWVIWFLADEKRLALIASWALLVALCGLAVQRDINAQRKASSAGRKVFHVAAVAVLLPGVLVDVGLITLAAGIAIALLLLIEGIRKLNIEPYSSKLQDAFDIYSDEKDCGGYSLTPIYLLVGVSCPLALVPRHAGRELPLLSGVLSTGIGDAAASWFGSRFGRHRWRGSQRTIEGTLFNILSQFLTVYILNYYGLLPGEHVLRSVALSSAVSAAVEANTDQVDNLVLPLVTLMSLMLY